MLDAITCLAKNTIQTATNHHLPNGCQNIFLFSTDWLIIAYEEQVFKPLESTNRKELRQELTQRLWRERR